MYVHATVNDRNTYKRGNQIHEDVFYFFYHFTSDNFDVSDNSLSYVECPSNKNETKIEQHFIYFDVGRHIIHCCIN